jgi:ribonuclease P protein component
MDARAAGFERADRLRRSSEFQRLRREGRRQASSAFVLVVAPGVDRSDLKRTRLGIAVGRRVGNAVVRNRVKRRIREWFRHQRASLRRGVDVVVIGRAPAAALSGREIWQQLDGLARRASGAGEAE